MITKKTWLKPLLVSVLSIALLSACSQGGNDKPSNEEPVAEPTKAAESAIVDGKYTTPIEITSVGRQRKYTNGDTKENNVHSRWAEEKLGIKIKNIWEPANTDQYKQKLQLALSSGEEIPDFVPYYDDPVVIGQLIDSEEFMAIDELFEQYASPVLKEHAEKHPEIWYPYTKDGKKYALPILENLDNDNTALWFREDWMKKLNLSAPKTIADLEIIMEQFKNNNPDNLPPDQVYPLTGAMKSGYNSWMGSLEWVFAAYGEVPEQWNMAEDGTLRYGSIHPGTKQALAKLNEWMKKGYIHPDAALWDEGKSAEIWTKGNAGILPGAQWIPDWPAPDLVKNVPHAEYKAYPIPAGPDGKIGTKWRSSTGANGNILISKDAKHPEAIFVYYNYLLENYANPSVGGEFEYGFAQGYDWDIVDGQPTSDPAKIKDYNNEFMFITGFNNNPAVIPDLYMMTLVKLANGEQPETPYEKLLAQKRKPENWYGAKVVMDQKDIRRKNYFNGAPTETMQSKWNLLKQSEAETFNKIIYGKLPLDEYDAFVERWKKNGGEQVTKEVNEWYQSVSGK
ncbi:extracellular solute-binding protein [Paenibacillus sp. LHD-117]|uniref:extracellular solute-binding protein n=1 Tax=Paenibacillus sp. LHD-117 TaxID=3071412 RepID=UPI0027DFE343|nr:extracellular solute-binding protein [Paenibacillus sp. LHD-117]MDQ6421566.1 extracellular solute-binding protein [Paenibacillus sp. LHD-117]